MNINPPKNFPAPWASAWGEDYFGFWQAFEIKGVQQIMRYIPEGQFMMGSPKDEAERIESSEKQHKVIIEHGFWCADTASTQELWQVVMNDNPSDFKEDSQNPVDSISWDDCKVFITKLNKALGENFLRLPSEAEWEYSCRAGTTTPFSVGETINTDQANFDGNFPYETKKETIKVSIKEGLYRGKTVSVVSFQPNQWGLYQMHGNVWEWCEDVYTEDYSVREADDGSQRVLRGGSWVDHARNLRSAYRSAISPGFRYRFIGLRLAGGFDPTSRL